MLRRSGLLKGIASGQYRAVVQQDDPAQTIPNGRSLIISYYDGKQYLCTKHELTDGNNKCVHQDVEDILMNGIRFNRLPEPKK